MIIHTLIIALVPLIAASVSVTLIILVRRFTRCPTCGKQMTRVSRTGSLRSGGAIAWRCGHCNNGGMITSLKGEREMSHERANVLVKDEQDPGVFLYTHSGGPRLPLLVRGALMRRQRWNQAPYLARLIFSGMTWGSSQGDAGFGISSILGDNNYPVIVVDTAKQTVSYISEDDAREKRTDRPGASWSFEEYVQAPARAIAGEIWGGGINPS